MAKKNKDILKDINYSLNIIKRIKDNEVFTIDEKKEILNKFVGVSEDNNSYFTPFFICKFMCDCLNIKGDAKVVDLSAGIGNMVRPLITEYGKLKDNITFDLYELDKNTSLAGQKAFEDYENVNYYGCVDTLDLGIEEQYDFVIGNPPFTGSVEYQTEWNTDKKGKPKKKNDIVNSFIDKSFKVCRDNGYVALVLPSGFLFKGNATEKLREYLSNNFDLKLLMELDADTFENAGLTGTSIGTNLIIWQKCKTDDNKAMIVELSKLDDIKLQLHSIPNYFQMIQKPHHIQFNSSSNDKIYGLLKEGILEDDEIEKGEKIGTCYCCNNDIYENEFYRTYEKKEGGEVVVCLECENDELMYSDKIKRNLVIGGENYEISKEEEKHIRKLKDIKQKENQIKRQMEGIKNIYICTNNPRDTFIDETQQVHGLKFVKLSQGISEDNDNTVVKIKLPYLISKKYNFDNQVFYRENKIKKVYDRKNRKINEVAYEYEYKFDKLEVTIDDLRIEHYKARKDKKEDWQDRERYIYHGSINCSEDLYNTTFSIFYYPNDEKTSVYIDYDFICSMSYKFKRLIEDRVLNDLLGGDGNVSKL